MVYRENQETLVLRGYRVFWVPVARWGLAEPLAVLVMSAHVDSVDSLEILASQGRQALEVLQAPQVQLDRLVNQAALVSRVPGVSQVLVDRLVAVVVQGRKVEQDSQGRLVTEG